jgi:hypothetical protein
MGSRKRPDAAEEQFLFSLDLKEFEAAPDRSAPEREPAPAPSASEREPAGNDDAASGRPAGDDAAGEGPATEDPAGGASAEEGTAAPAAPPGEVPGPTPSVLVEDRTLEVATARGAGPEPEPASALEAPTSSPEAPSSSSAPAAAPAPRTAPSPAPAPQEADLNEAMTRAERAVFHRSQPEFLLDRARRVFHRALLDERVLVTHPSTGVPSNADKDSGTSVRYARAVVEGIGAVEAAPRAPGQSISRNFERAVAAYLQGVFPAFGALRPGEWMVRRLGDRNEYGGIEDASEIFEQYEHLVSLREAIESDRSLRGLLGYEAEILAPDVVVARAPIPDAELNEFTRLVDPLGPLAAASPLRAAVQPKHLLHAVVACKWTLRSDRAQQVRSEAQHLMRNRRGRAPHLVLVTGEPMPSRIAAVALGTGDLDCVYHFALHELMDAIDPQVDPAGAELLHTMVQGRRLRDISDLPLDLAV